MAKLTRNEKQFLTDLIKPVQAKLRLAWFMSVISTVVLVIQSWLLAKIFSEWLTQQFSGQVLSLETLWHYLPWLVLCFIARPLLQFMRELIASKASLTVRTQLRQRLLSALATLGMARTQFGSDGSISSQVIDQTDALDGFISRFSVQRQVVASTPIILLIAVATQSLLAAGILLATAPLVPVFMILIGKMTAKKSAEQFTALSQLSGRFLDWVRGITTLKRLQATHIAEQDLSHASEDYRKRTMDVLKIAFLNGAVLEFLSALCIALVAVYLGFGLLGVLPWDKGHVPVEYFGALFILLLTPEFYLPLRQLGADYHAKAQAEGAVQSLLPLLTKADNMLTKADQTASSNQHQHQYQQTATLDYQTPPSLTFNQLAIYNKVTNKTDTDNTDNSIDKKSKTQQTQTKAMLDSEATRTRLAPMSFKLQAGERIGLVGESGAGKSSLLQAVMGFANYEGEILVNGNDHHRLNVDEFREHIGYLAQQVALLPISIADNLRLANPTASDGQLIEVLQAVELYELIQQLPKGINTLLGERGRGLSGGQQHRLGIAQLLLRDSKLWLLDEPTEHLDPDTADTIHKLLEEVSQGKTVIWITHSIEQLPWLDRVVEIGN